MSNAVRRGLAAFVFLFALGGTALADVTITDADNGKTVSVAQGDTLIVKLTGHHGSGNFWFLDADLTPELILSGRTTEAVDAAGAPEVTTFSFTTGEPGQVTFRATYRAPGTTATDKSDVSVTVDVTPAKAQ
ncbi:MAG TPA: protease inhibitor I42 family protein [Rhizomicrobium sp.]|nr:protease inhibitor I42 family protein [Rhizomicrobium sp.]